MFSLISTFTCQNHINRVKVQYLPVPVPVGTVVKSNYEAAENGHIKSKVEIPQVLK